MPPALLYYTYGAVMLASLACFVQAYRTRSVTAVHMGWGQAGMYLSIGGILVVLLVTYAWDGRVEQRWPTVVRIHRILALGATALVILIAVSGWRRWALHRRLYIAFFPVYIATVVTALVGYTP